MYADTSTYIHAATNPRSRRRVHRWVQQPAANGAGDTVVSTYCTYLACMIRKQCAAKHHAAPDCEISDGPPIAGQQMNTARVPSHHTAVLMLPAVGSGFARVLQ